MPSLEMVSYSIVRPLSQQESTQATVVVKLVYHFS